VSPDLELALRLADTADAITLARFQAQDLVVTSKPDLTPVSDADLAVETALRDVLLAERPGDAVVLDPVDGTKNFVRGAPVWASLIALLVDGRVEVGVVSAPALGRRWWAARGEGAFANGEPIRVSSVPTLDDAFLSYSSLTGWEQQGRLDSLLSLSRRCWRTRAFGDFWSHVLVAEGAVDASFEPEVSLWDLAPLQVIVEEAGGRFTSLEGEARPDAGSVVCSNGLLHDEVLAGLSSR
jgi:histidinol-phosphatase